MVFRTPHAYPGDSTRHTTWPSAPKPERADRRSRWGRSGDIRRSAPVRALAPARRHDGDRSDPSSSYHTLEPDVVVRAGRRIEVRRLLRSCTRLSPTTSRGPWPTASRKARRRVATAPIVHDALVLRSPPFRSAAMNVLTGAEALERHVVMETDSAGCRAGRRYADGQKKHARPDWCRQRRGGRADRHRQFRSPASLLRERHARHRS